MDLIDKLHVLSDQGLRDVEDVADQGADVDLLMLDHKLALLHLGSVEDVIDQLEETAARGLDDGNGLDGLRWRWARKERLRTLMRTFRWERRQQVEAVYNNGRRDILSLLHLFWQPPRRSRNEGLREADDSVEGSAQLMRHGREEVVLPCDVLQGVHVRLVKG